MERILVALDLPLAENQGILDFACHLAEPMQAELWLLHVAAPDAAFVGLEAGPSSVRDSRAHTLRAEHRDLHEIVGGLRALGMQAHALLVEGVTADTILEQASRREVDLIVLGSHGHGALYKALLGGTSDSVLRHASCPVVVVPDPERKKN